jgi:hypothetical protein
VKPGRIAGIALMAWWIFLLVAVGLGGSAYLVFKALETGNIIGAMLCGLLFAGACVYLYRTYKARADILEGPGD